MDFYEVFSSPFKLSEFETLYEPIPEIIAKYKTTDIVGETTKEEIYILSKMYFNQIILQYKNYTIDNQPTTESSYKLSVGLIEDDELKFKHIYSCFYNNIEDRVSWVNKYSDNYNIEGDFFVCIDVNTMVITDYEPNNDDASHNKPIRKTIKESECVICYENKPNILFSECLHLCVCDVCDSKGRFSRCPMCRTKIKTNKIRIT